MKVYICINTLHLCIIVALREYVCTSAEWFDATAEAEQKNAKAAQPLIPRKSPKLFEVLKGVRTVSES